MSRPTWARWVTRISLVVGVLALIFTVYKTGPHTIVSYFRRIGWWWFAVAALEVVITSLDAVAIRAFLSPDQHRVRLRSAVLSQLAGRSVNAVTPSGNLGEAVKVSVLTDFVSNSQAVATILLYNIVSFNVELVIAAIAAPFLAILVPMPTGLRWVIGVTGIVCLAISIGLYALVQRGMIASIAKLPVKLHLVSHAWFERWEPKLRSVDDKLRLVAGARKRDRLLGIGAVTLSRLTSMTLSLIVLHAVGGPITVGFVAAYTVGGLVIYLASSLVPMGLGISEGGNFWLFRALGENPAWGVTLVFARRVTLIVYAAIGIVLVTASETVQRARSRQGRARDVAPLPTATALPLVVTLPQPVAAARVTDAD